jgi:hypothetical protein
MDDYKMSASDLVSSQIWLDLPKDDHHFFYILLWMIAIFGYRPKLLGKTLGYTPPQQPTL